jgi:hypothetical protein
MPTACDRFDRRVDYQSHFWPIGSSWKRTLKLPRMCPERPDWHSTITTESIELQRSIIVAAFVEQLDLVGSERISRNAFSMDTFVQGRQGFPSAQGQKRREALWLP